MTGERVVRRLAAILAADVVGYSRLMGRDENGTLARLREHRKQRFEPTLARHGGRLVKLTGDGALVEFPSAVDALSAAIEFQQAMADANKDHSTDTAIVFRIGLHLGDLIVEGDDLYGDGVNVAARLEAEAPPGGIVVSRAVREAVDGRLKAKLHALGDLALKNIERPIRAFRVEWEAPDWKATVAPAPKAVRDEPALASATPALALPDKPSIAVLPFQNMSGDPEQAYFVDGLVEEIITALSRNRSLFVSARNSSFTYQGRAVDIRQVGRELGVRYVLEGSVRKGGERVRITGQLIEAATGAHIWADRFDGALEDIFELQDRVANRVATFIGSEVETAEIERVTRKPTEPRAYDLYLRAKAAFSEMTSDKLDEALELAKQALALDPSAAQCHALVAQIHAQRIANSFTSDPAADAAAAEQAVQRAHALDSRDAFVLAVYGSVLMFALGRRNVEALPLLDRAIDLDPNNAFAWTLRGMCNRGLGKEEEAIRDVEYALRLNPRDPNRWFPQHVLAWGHLIAGRYDEAIAGATAALQLQPRFGPTLRVAIAAYALAGKPERAQEMLAKHRALEPQTRISTLRDTYLRRVTAPAFDALINGLRKAGFPE